MKEFFILNYGVLMHNHELKNNFHQLKLFRE